MSNQSTRHDQLHQNLRNTNQWMRLAYMIAFAVMLHLAGLVMWVLCALQFLFALITGKNNDNLRVLGASIIEFIRQALAFVSYNTEHKPFPFADWPNGDESVVSSGTKTSEVEGQYPTETKPILATPAPSDSVKADDIPTDSAPLE